MGSCSKTGGRVMVRNGRMRFLAAFLAAAMVLTQAFAGQAMTAYAGEKVDSRVAADGREASDGQEAPDGQETEETGLGGFILTGDNEEGNQEVVIVDENGDNYYEKKKEEGQEEDYLPSDDIPSAFTLVPQAEIGSSYGMDGALAALENSKTYVTPVKNQQGYGLCWAFAATAAVESSMVKNNVCSMSDDRADLSEIYLAWFTKRPNQAGSPGDGSNSEEPISGGNTYYVTKLLSSGVGLELEKSYPYVTDYQNDPAVLINHSKISDSEYKKSSIAVLSESVDFGNVDSTNPASRQIIQESIMNNGAVTVSYFADQTVASQNPDSTGMISYYSGRTGSTNHAVCIVGWNDNYSSDNFKSKPAGNGAWLVKNSWGTRWSDGGYFWMSYYEGTLCNFRTFKVQKDAPSDIYDYNGVGAERWYSLAGYAAVIYDVKLSSSADVINSIGTYFVNGTRNIKISIYTSDKDMGGNPFAGTQRLKDYAVSKNQDGFYNIPINSDISLKGCTQFSVVIWYDKSIPVEGDNTYNNSSGKSYLGTNISRLYNLPSSVYTGSGDVCIKAYTAMPSSRVPNYEALEKIYNEALAFSQEKGNNAGGMYDAEKWGEFKTAIGEAKEHLDNRISGSDNTKYMQVRGLIEKLQGMLEEFKNSSESSGGQYAGIYMDSGKSEKASSGILAWSNGGKAAEGTSIVNTKVKTLYTDITASKITYEDKKGKEKTKKGKVVIGVTSSKELPQLNKKNKIVDEEASKIVKAKLGKGKITITAKSPGTAYVWVMDTGDQKAYAYVKVRVNAAAISVKTYEKVNDEEKQAKSMELPISKYKTVYIKGTQDKSGTNAEYATYGVYVPEKNKENVYITTDETGKIVSVKGVSLTNGKKTKVKLFVKSQQNAKKAVCTFTVTNPVTGYKFEYGDKLTVDSSGKTENITMEAPTSKAAVTAQAGVTVETASDKDKTTDKTVIRAVAGESGYTFTDKGKLKINAKPSGEAKKITAKLKNGTITFTAKKGTAAGTEAYFLLFSNADKGCKVIKVTLK